jgi:3-phenylpropionate/trans-cinnamate dioxygenase ferredoxin component
VSFQMVCSLADVPRGRATRVLVGDTAIAVVRVDDEVFAIEDRCSHADVALSEGEVEGCTLECWLHGSAFDLRTGEPLMPPATRPVATYATRIVGDDASAVIEIDPTPVLREKV